MTSAGTLILEQLRDHQPLQGRERVRVAEELGDADQQVAKQQRHLVGLRPQPVDVAAEVVQLQHLHPPMDPTQERLLLVAAEVVADLLQQDGADLALRVGPGLIGFRLLARRGSGAIVSKLWM